LVSRMKFLFTVESTYSKNYISSFLFREAVRSSRLYLSSTSLFISKQSSSLSW